MTFGATHIVISIVRRRLTVTSKQVEQIFICRCSSDGIERDLFGIN